MKNKVIHFVDILTVIFLSIQIQSTVVFIFEDYSYLHYYSWNKFFIYYNSYGLSTLVYDSFRSEFIYYQFLFILCNSDKDDMYVQKRNDVWNA